MKTFVVGDNSGARRELPELTLIRRDALGLRPGDTVQVRFDDDYIKNGVHPPLLRTYRVSEIIYEPFYPRFCLRLSALGKESQ